MVIGHRGAPGYRPEHTAASYELAAALGADAVEPDLVATRDGVLVIRHENEISGTTDVATRPEFSSRRATREVDGVERTGWFTEDFTWAELATLRATERLGALRQESASFDGRFPMLRLRDLFAVLDRVGELRDRPLGMVAEFKHAHYFDQIGLSLDELFVAELDDAGWGRRDDRLVCEAFEPGVLERLASRGIRSPRVFLLEAKGAPADLVAASGHDAPAFDSFATEHGLLGLARRFDGVSVDKSRLLRDAAPRRRDGALPLVGAELVDAAHSAGLRVFTWTLRPENRFLAKPYRRGSSRAAFGEWFAEFTRIIGTGVDGIFVDHPDLGVEARRAVLEGPFDDE